MAAQSSFESSPSACGDWGEQESSQQSCDTGVAFGLSLQRSVSAGSVCSGSGRKRSAPDSPGPPSAKKAKADPGEQPAAGQAQQQHRERQNNGGAAVLAASAGQAACLVAGEQFLELGGDGPCELPAEGPRFAARLDSHGNAPELTEMLSYLYDAENDRRPSPKYMEEQHSAAFSPLQYLDASMRTTAVSWLVDVSRDFNLHQESLFLAVALLDRYLSATEGVARNDLQLISVACMLVAAKHEEERHPSVVEFAGIADNSFQVSALLQMERQLLDVLGFRINTPTPHSFWRFFRHINPLQPAAAALASYLTELALLDYEFLSYAPSEVAATAILLALGHQELAAAARGWFVPASATFAPLAERSGYRAAELHECARDLCILHARAAAVTDVHSPFMAVKDKYRGARWHAASLVAPVAWLPDALCASRSATIGAVVRKPAPKAAGSQAGAAATAARGQ